MKRERKSKNFLVLIQKVRAKKIERNLQKRRKINDKLEKTNWHYSLSQIKKDFPGYQQFGHRRVYHWLKMKQKHWIFLQNLSNVLIKNKKY